MRLELERIQHLVDALKPLRFIVEAIFRLDTIHSRHCGRRALNFGINKLALSTPITSELKAAFQRRILM